MSSTAKQPDGGASNGSGLNLEILSRKVEELAAEKSKPDHERSPLFPALDHIKRLIALKATGKEIVAILAQAGLTTTEPELSRFRKSAFASRPKKSSRSSSKSASATE